MVGNEIFIIVMISILALTLIVCLPIALVFWLVARKRTNRHMSGNEEDRLKQIWSGLRRMEERVENLETILATKRGKSDSERAGDGEDIAARRLHREPHSRDS